MSFGSEVNKFSLEPSDGIEDPLGVWLFGPWQRAASWLSALPANRGAVFGGQMFPHLENHINHGNLSLLRLPQCYTIHHQSFPYQLTTKLVCMHVKGAND